MDIDHHGPERRTRLREGPNGAAGGRGGGAGKEDGTGRGGAERAERRRREGVRGREGGEGRGGAEREALLPILKETLQFSKRDPKETRFFQNKRPKRDL